MDRIIPLLEFTFDEDNLEGGMVGISMVDKPAIESNFEFFNKEQKKPTYFKIEGYEGMVQGLALKPDKPILRYDSENNPYYGFFSKHTIKKLRDSFQKNLMNNNVSTSHDGNIIDGYLTESYIIDSPERLADVKLKGIEDATMGSWYVQYKIEDNDTFQKVINGELTGFSIEAFLSVFSKLNNNNNTNKLNTRMNKILEKFEALLNEFKEDKTETFEVAKIYDGTDSVEFTEVGASVTIIAEDGTRTPASEGNYVLDDQRELSVDAAGNLAEVRSTSDETPAEPQAEEAAAAAEAAVTAIPLAQFESVKEELETIKAELETIKAEKVTLSAEIVTLKAENVKLSKAPATVPVVNTKNVNAKLTQEQFSKLSSREKIAIKNGIEIFSLQK